MRPFDSDVEALHRADANDEAGYCELSGTPVVGQVHEVLTEPATAEQPCAPVLVYAVMVNAHGEHVRYCDGSGWWYRGVPHPTLGAATAAVRERLWPQG